MRNEDGIPLVSPFAELRADNERLRAAIGDVLEHREAKWSSWGRIVHEAALRRLEQVFKREEEGGVSEVIYAVRRADGEQIGEYDFYVVGGPHDWTPAEDDSDGIDDAYEYQMVKMTVEVIGTRILPFTGEADPGPVLYDRREGVMTDQTHHYGDDCQPPHRALEPCSSLVRVADDRCANCGWEAETHRDGRSTP